MDLREMPSSSGETHPWETSRIRFFVDVLTTHHAVFPNARVLDVGAGDAHLADDLARERAPLDVLCWDTHYVAEQLVNLRQLRPRVRLQREEPEGEFDLVMLMDVLEHVEDDHALLRNVIERHLAPDGFVLISVPANPHLTTSHDHALGHVRRYRPREARALVQRCGLSIRASGGLFHSLLLPRALQVMRERVLGAKDISTTQLRWSAPASVTRAVLAALSLDNRVSRLAASRSWEIPGLSWWALCAKS